MQELKNKKILIVDDEQEILSLLEGILRREGFYRVYTAQTCEQAMQTARGNNIALFVLDVNLPDGDGFTLFEDIRRYSRAPVMFLTARGEAEDKLQGLGLGADDYMIKPFLTREFILRITAILKRVYQIGGQMPACFFLSDRTINLETASVQKDGQEILLTAKEFILLKKLLENQNRIVTNDALCMAAWGDDYYGYENTLMVHIRRIRKKIEQNPSAPRHLLTVKGLGYKLVTEDA